GRWESWPPPRSSCPLDAASARECKKSQAPFPPRATVGAPVSKPYGGPGGRGYIALHVQAPCQVAGDSVRRRHTALGLYVHSVAHPALARGGAGTCARHLDLTPGLGPGHVALAHPADAG